MKIPREKFFTNLDHRGNTSSASIPMALDEMNRAGLLLPGMHLVLVGGFGGGLTWGAQVWFDGRGNDKAPLKGATIP